jgi:hypothetical protein
VLQAYERAYSSLTADAVKRVYPAVNEQALRRSFADMKSQRLQIQDETIRISGAMATVTCTVDTRFQPQAGREQHSSRQTVFRLEKRNNVWYIVSLQ